MVQFRFAQGRSLLWGLLAVPGAWLLWAWATGFWTYGEVVTQSGRLATWLLMLTLAVTPLRLILRRGAWLSWLVRRRRDFGVACFAYAAGHTLVYLIRKHDFALILEESAELWLWTGWLAFLALLSLAVTSNDAAVRLLRRNWKALHRLAYVAAALAFVHWSLSAFDPLAAYLHIGTLGALEAVRIALQWRQRVT